MTISSISTVMTSARWSPNVARSAPVSEPAEQVSRRELAARASHQATAAQNKAEVVGAPAPGTSALATMTQEAASLAAKVAPMSAEQLAEVGETLVASLAKQDADSLVTDDQASNNMLTLKGLLAAWGQSNSPYDLNGDGTVGLSDMLILMQNGGAMAMPEGQSEPLTLEGLLAAWGTSNATFDLNGDGTVDESDLLILLSQLDQEPEPSPPGGELTLKGLFAAWGQSDSPYDLNGDGIVDTSDLLMLLQAGGTMPMPEGKSEPLTLNGLLAAWGTSNPVFDLNGDGIVDTSDLLLLLSKMGSEEPDNSYVATAGLPIESLLAAARADPMAAERNIQALMAALNVEKESEG